MLDHLTDDRVTIVPQYGTLNNEAPADVEIIEVSDGITPALWYAVDDGTYPNGCGIDQGGATSFGFSRPGDGATHAEGIIFQLTDPEIFFALNMFDFGDYNPLQYDEMWVEMKAFSDYNRTIMVVEPQVVSQDLTSSSYEITTGYACSDRGNPGNIVFEMDLREDTEARSMLSVELSFFARSGTQVDRVLADSGTGFAQFKTEAFEA